MMRTGGKTGATVALLATAYLVLRRLGQSYGATGEECHRALPGDLIVSHPDLRTTHAITIDARPAAVWPWLVQMGWHRGGWYTAHWVDRLLFPANDPSAATVHPDLQDLEVGDFVPDGPPESGCGFTVDALEPEHHLVLHSRTHLPPAWRELARLDFSWSFVLEPLPGGRTRFLFRSAATIEPWWARLAYQLVILPADFVMSRQMLHGIRDRACAPTRGGRTLVGTVSWPGGRGVA